MAALTVLSCGAVLFVRSSERRSSFRPGRIRGPIVRLQEMFLYPYIPSWVPNVLVPSKKGGTAGTQKMVYYT